MTTKTSKKRIILGKIGVNKRNEGKGRLVFGWTTDEEKMKGKLDIKRNEGKYS